MKTEIDRVDATPSKRLFLSIIADYDLNRSICELIDNGLDVWARGGRQKPIHISVTLNADQQTITVGDDAGGVSRSELRSIVAPGESNNAWTDQTIGIFGVGTKRAVVALSQDIKIKTRNGAGQTLQVDFDDTWIEDDDWELPVYEVPDIPKGTTVVELLKLRVHVTDEAISQLKDHLRATYAQFLKDSNVEIRLNGERLTPTFFEDWAYPPNFGPRRYTGELRTAEGRVVKVEVVAGLASESSPAAGEYGVYFYCNDRLVGRAIKSFEVGFTKGLAGVAHPKVSLTRVIVRLHGDARAMPWNSSKSDISTKHEIFIALRDWLVQVVKDFASLSRIWMGEWPEKVFKYRTGKIQNVENVDFPLARKSFLPPMPRSKPRYGEIMTQKNRSVAKKKPWAQGLYEGVVAADLIFKQRLAQKNRIALIVLDSTLEIAFKEYLVNESGAHYKDTQLAGIFASRANVHNEIKKYVKFGVSVWNRINHYYRLRNKFVHERATVGINDAEVLDFREVVERVLKRLHKLKFS